MEWARCSARETGTGRPSPSRGLGRMAGHGPVDRPSCAGRRLSAAMGGRESAASRFGGAWAGDLTRGPGGGEGARALRLELPQTFDVYSCLFDAGRRPVRATWPPVVRGSGGTESCGIRRWNLRPGGRYDSGWNDSGRPLWATSCCLEGLGAQGVAAVRVTRYAASGSAGCRGLSIRVVAGACEGDRDRLEWFSRRVMDRGDWGSAGHGPSGPFASAGGGEKEANSPLDFSGRQM